MAGRYKNVSGVPLGGIGAGKIEFCPDGILRNFTTHNNLDIPIQNMELTREANKEGIRDSFFGAYVEGHGSVLLKQDHYHPENGLREEQINYTGEFPFINVAYTTISDVSLSMEAFSSLSLDDDGSDGYKDSSLPCASFTLKAVNNGSTPRYVSLLFSLFNLIGMGGYPFAPLKDMRNNDVEYKKEGNNHYLYFTHLSPKVDKRLNGNYTMLLPANDGMDVGYVIHDTYDELPSYKGYGLQDYYRKEGKLPNTKLSYKNGTPYIHGALSAGKKLNPGEILEVNFILAWYFPDRVANTSPDIIYRNYYTKFFRSSTDVADYFSTKKEELYARTKQWHNKINSSNLPDWFKLKLKNDIFPLYSNTMYIDDGRFSVNESPTDMYGCMGTIDQRAASNAIYTMSFPRLSKSELTLFSEQQIDEKHENRFGKHWDTLKGTYNKIIDRIGAIRHDIGYDDLEGGLLGKEHWASLHWPDLSMVYTLQIYEHCTWTGDDEFLNYAYPKVKGALKFLKELDQDKDGLPDLWGPGCNTYDNGSFPYFGISSFVSSLYLAALKAAKNMAEWVGDKEGSEEYEKHFHLVRKVVEDRLWDDSLGYYISWVDENYKNWENSDRPHDRQSRNSMIAQIAGQWFANMLDLGDVLDKNRIKSSLQKMSEKNVGLAQYCPANEVSSDNSEVSDSWPYYIETYYAANAVYEGMINEGLQAIENIHQAITVVDGSPWDAHLVYRDNGNSGRCWGKWYMTNPASWFMLPALGGFDYNAREARLMLTPNVPANWKELKNLPIFMPLFWGSVSAANNSASFTVDKLINTDSLKVKTLALRKGSVEIFIDNRKITFELLRETTDKMYLKVDLTLIGNSKLSVKYM
ncbi:MAG: hypothetical protein K0S76_1565 [Herbinix sp.]|jgi:uncharacterized protein (DUF608 family)|nr:hypothetical protein [Herbinix sp.]